MLVLNVSVYMYMCMTLCKCAQWSVGIYQSMNVTVVDMTIVI